MITRLEITSIHMEIDDNLRHYVTKKIGQCDRFLPRRIRTSMHAEITLKEEKSKERKICTCEVVMYLPHEVITTTESTINMYAAIDIVESKLINQLRKYKAMHTSPKLYRRVLAGIKHKS
jgi:ribosomal subunit interface protein